MFRALLCPSSGARDHNVHYNIPSFSSWFDVGWSLGAVKAGVMSGLQPGHYSTHIRLLGSDTLYSSR